MGEHADEENCSKKTHGTTLALACPCRNTGHRLGGIPIEPKMAGRDEPASPDPAWPIYGWLATG